MRWVVLVLLFAGCDKESVPNPGTGAPKETQAAGESESESQPAPLRPIQLPRAYRAWKSNDELEKDSLVVSLDHVGRLFLERVQGFEEPLSLEDLAGILPGGTHNRIGLRGQGAPSDLRVLLRIDRRAPWQWVQWILIVLAENKIHKIWFAVAPKEEEGRPSERLTRKVKAFLPTDRGISPVMTRPDDVRTAKVFVRARSDKPPEYRYGPRRTEKALTVLGWLRHDFDFATKEQKVAARNLYGEIRASPTAPSGACVTLLSMFLRAGFFSVNFFGTQIPAADIRRAVPFKAPRSGR